MEELKDKLEKLEKVVTTLTKDYKAFGDITNENLSALMATLFQYVSIVEAMISALVDKGIVDKDELFEQANKNLTEIMSEIQKIELNTNVKGQ
jgi:hypothetical protein